LKGVRSQNGHKIHFLEESKQLLELFEAFSPPDFLLKVTAHSFQASHGEVSSGIVFGCFLSEEKALR